MNFDQSIVLSGAISIKASRETKNTFKHLQCDRLVSWLRTAKHQNISEDVYHFYHFEECSESS